MGRYEGNQMLEQAMMIFARARGPKTYECSISYELTPDVFAVDSDQLAEEPFADPHKYRVALAYQGHVIFDAAFANPLPAMELMARGIELGIADSSWVDWMRTLDEEWSPSRVAS